MFVLNPLFEKHKDKFNNRITFFNNYVNALQFQESMFVYDCKQDIDLWLFELLLNMEGMVGMTKDEKGNLVYGSLILNGEFDNYGIPQMGEIITYNGTNFSGEINKDIIICWNNSTHSPDFNTYEFALNSTEVKKSLKTAILQTRIMNMVSAKNDKVKKAIDKAMANIEKGKPITVLADDILTNEMGSNPIDTYELTHPEHVHSIQFLSKYYDDLQRWYYTLYGQPIQGTGKMAQQTEEELQGQQTLSTIIPFNKLKERQVFCEKVSNILGVSLQVDFAEPWKMSLGLTEKDNETSNPLTDIDVKGGFADENN